MGSLLYNLINFVLHPSKLQLQLFLRWPLPRPLERNGTAKSVRVSRDSNLKSNEFAGTNHGLVYSQADSSESETGA
jgi:hypothetical protein